MLLSMRANALSNAALAGAWALVFGPVLSWLWATFTGEAFRLNLILLGAAVALLFAQRPSRESIASLVSAPLRIRARPLGLLAVSLAAYVAADRAFDVHIVEAILFGVATYALAGLYLSPEAWRRARVPALLLVAVLPFGEQANTYLGFSARLATAQLVEHALTPLQIASIPADTIMLLESGVAYIDVPCSGVKSLWTGAVFFLAATQIHRRRIDLLWLAAGVLFAVAVFAANVARVLAVVLLLAHDLRPIAEALHEPLGLLGFALACTFAVLMLRKLPAPAPDPEPTTTERLALTIPAPARAATFAALLLALSFARASHTRQAPPPPADFHFEFPASLSSRPVELTPSEEGLFRRVGGTFVEKRRFAHGDLTGTVLVVYTTSWRAHHPPELCLAGSGVRVDSLQTIAFSQLEQLRVASLDGGTSTAMYWYQSPDQTTGDLLDRILTDVRGDEHRWVLISIRVDAPLDPTGPRIRELYNLLHDLADRALLTTDSESNRERNLT